MQYRYPLHQVQKYHFYFDRRLRHHACPFGDPWHTHDVISTTDDIRCRTFHILDNSGHISLLQENVLLGQWQVISNPSRFCVMLCISTSLHCTIHHNISEFSRQKSSDIFEKRRQLRHQYKLHQARVSDTTGLQHLMNPRTNHHVVPNVCWPFQWGKTWILLSFVDIGNPLCDW